MKDTKIETKLLGTLIYTEDEGHFETHTLSLQDNQVSFDVYVFENTPLDKYMDMVKKYLDNIPLMYEKIKKEIQENYKSNETMTFFIECQQDFEQEDLMDIFGVSSSEALTPEVFIQNIELRGLHIAEVADTDTIDCTVDFSLHEAYSDELLVFCFDNDLNITNISHES